MNIPQVFRSARKLITMESIRAEHERNLAVGIEAAHIDGTTRLDLKRDAALRYLGRRWILHPQSVFSPCWGPTVLK